MDRKYEVAFFQAVKAKLAKLDGTGVGDTDESKKPQFVRWLIKP